MYNTFLEDGLKMIVFKADTCYIRNMCKKNIRRRWEGGKDNVKQILNCAIIYLCSQKIISS